MLNIENRKLGVRNDAAYVHLIEASAVPAMRLNKAAEQLVHLQVLSTVLVVNTIGFQLP